VSIASTGTTCSAAKTRGRLLLLLLCCMPLSSTSGLPNHLLPSLAEGADSKQQAHESCCKTY
jgi:hypothetical protein